MDDPTLFSPIDEEVDLDDPLGNLLKKSLMLKNRNNKPQENGDGTDTKNNHNANAKEDSANNSEQQNSKTLTNDETVALEQDESSSDFVLVDLVS